ncbi:MAG: hypothetical protein K2L88_03850, partial [Clostridiales bacterium]|nr:hypothetical protein [Clostridiales bacterium]
YQYSNGLLAWYDADLQKEIYVSGIAFSPLEAINYRLNSADVLLLSCEGRKLMTWNGRKIIEYKNSPSISSMALHYERLFVTSRDERTKVFFSKNLDPTQWEIGVDGGGFIELLDERGFLNKVVSFGSYLYIFRDYGISRVTAYGDQSEFSVVNMFVTAGRIFPSSIAVCGNCIMFLASDGLYRFDGYDCKRVLPDISTQIRPNDNCACAYYDGKYYLACNMTFGDFWRIGSEVNTSHKTNALIVYDPSSGEYSLSRGLDIRYMKSCTYNGEDFLMCCESGKGGVVERGAALFTTKLSARWNSAVIDMGAPDKLKTLTNVHFENKDNGSSMEVSLGIYVDGELYEMYIKRPTCGDINLNLKGRKFMFTIETSAAESNVSPLSIKYSMV